MQRDRRPLQKPRRGMVVYGQHDAGSRYTEQAKAVGVTDTEIQWRRLTLALRTRHKKSREGKKTK